MTGDHGHGDWRQNEPARMRTDHGLGRLEKAGPFLRVFIKYKEVCKAGTLFPPVGLASANQTYRSSDCGKHSHLVLRGPSIKIADSTNAPDSLSTILLRTKLAAEIADVEVNASIERGELPVKDILNK